MASPLSITSLFGGDKPWLPLDWTSSDDRVRGGSSTSHLSCHPTSPIAIFHGNLDIKTLGRAGFASQRTSGDDRNWDLSSNDGLLLDIVKSDGKKYTLTLKDELLPRSPNGREQSTVSWEYDFEVERGGEKVQVKWDDLKPTYRGREKKDAEPLNLNSIKRVSLMMRSFFGTQEGDFSLSINSISATKSFSADGNLEPYRDDPNEARTRSLNGKLESSEKTHQSWLGWLLRSCFVC